MLSPVAVDTMLLDQTGGAVVVATPHPDQAPYGLGIWLERRDSQGRTLLASGVGAFGFAGWVDRAHDASGVFLVRYPNQQTYPYLRRICRETDAALLPDGVSCIGGCSAQCSGGTWLNANLAANPDFALLVSRAPANGIGGLVLGDPVPGGLGVVDLTAFVGPAPFVVATLFADADGDASVAAPLASGLLGSTFGLQTVWFGGDPCTVLGLQASHAIAVAVLP